MILWSKWYTRWNFNFGNIHQFNHIATIFVCLFVCFFCIQSRANFYSFFQLQAWILMCTESCYSQQQRNRDSVFWGANVKWIFLVMAPSTDAGHNCWKESNFSYFNEYIFQRFKSNRTCDHSETKQTASCSYLCLLFQLPLPVSSTENHTKYCIMLSALLLFKDIPGFPLLYCTMHICPATAEQHRKICSLLVTLYWLTAHTWVNYIPP